ncbi:uncharacterized protein I206_100359 [Kwoniella pini CBS 10737]|uniref:Phosphoglycerate mutase n=1 Tax=Kwoniella pini CBS 10737 TaxID=1296096 RepID=A0A1B9IEF3_9TREE|nr:uncharacterized protein I206_00966 [Kwoniella pini CBS 10737]OCF53660.1 hypothetical protein I206_00966 [Kwoniella pini CBS 10737]
MVKYTYTHLDEFFVLSQWIEDVKGPFGLRPPPGDWASFKARIQALNDACPPGESVKVIYAARHGQAEHNALADKYGEGAQIKYPTLDPDLTTLGRSQAFETRLALQREIKRGMPVPSKWFVSPFKRAGETCGIEWGFMFSDEYEIDGGNYNGGKGHGVNATVIENIREHLHVHVCDKRCSISQLKSQFTSFNYSKDMIDEDLIWQPIEIRDRETEEELVARRGEGIREILEKSQGDTYISITAHSGTLRGIYKSLNVIPRKLVVGEMNILVIRVKELQES